MHANVQKVKDLRGVARYGTNIRAFWGMMGCTTPHGASMTGAGPSPTKEVGPLGKQRREEILRRVHLHGYVSARQLADDYGVDPSTVRRDLDAMGKLGMVVRSHGGATKPDEPTEIPYEIKVETRVYQKRAIAQAVARMITPGQSLLLDSGSTTFEVARALRAHRGLSVVTNDLRVAAELAYQGDVRLIVIGGEALPNVYTLMSERAVDLISQYHVDFAVLGADAIDPRAITNTNSLEAPMKRAMIRAADKVLLVTDSSKFGRSALVRIAGLDDIDLVITDDGLDEAAASAYPVKILRVPVTPSAMSAKPAQGNGNSFRPALEPDFLSGAGPRAFASDRPTPA